MGKEKIITVYKTLMSFIAILFLCSLCAVPTGFSTSTASMGGEAYASVTAGDTEIEGWKPSEMVSTDMEIEADPGQAANRLEDIVIKIVQIAMPFLMIACVVLIVYNAIANIFRRQENQVSMGALIKNMIVNFFFILFAWVIIEAIVFVITNGEMILFSTLLGV